MISSHKTQAASFQRTLSCFRTLNCKIPLRKLMRSVHLGNYILEELLDGFLICICFGWLCRGGSDSEPAHRERQPVQPPICEQWGDKRHYFEPRSSIAPFKGDVLIIMIGRGLQLGQLAVTSYGNR